MGSIIYFGWLFVCLCIFFELRGTDQILGQIWEHIRESKPSTPAKEGARIVLNPGPINREIKSLEIAALNKGDIVARASATGASQVLFADHLFSLKEEDEWFESLKATPHPPGTGIEFLPGGGRSMTVEVKATDAQFESVIAGNAYFYVFFVTSFTDELTSPGKRLLASLCVRYQGKLENSRVCLSHNESRLLD
jgi:hypothetical protein